MQNIVIKVLGFTLMLVSCAHGRTQSGFVGDGEAQALVSSSMRSSIAPNVVIFIADDMGIGDTSAYQDLTGNPDDEQIDTPEMERLARLGTRFTDAHTSGATCSPSRISLMSGTYSFRSPLKTQAVRDTEHVHGVILPGRRHTIAHMLQRSGYSTYGYGKWHMALRGECGEDINDDGVIDEVGSGVIHEGPIECGFDTYTGTPGNFSYGGAMIQDKRYMRFGNPALNDYNLVPINSPQAVPWVAHGPKSPTDPNLYKVQPTVFKKLKQDMEEHIERRPDKPFFVYYASHSNHDPYVPANYNSAHPDGPRGFLNGKVIDTSVTKAGGMIHVNTVPDQNGDGIPDPAYKNNPKWIWNDAYRKKFWDHVSAVDKDGKLTNNGPTSRAMMVQENDIIVGYMLDFLEKNDDPRHSGHKLIDNTIFIFTSDNGADIRSEAAAGALPQSSDQKITSLTGFKGSRWEGGTRVPFIAAWPEPALKDGQRGVPASATSSAIFGLNDIYATLAEAVGYSLAPDEAVDSESLVEVWAKGVQGSVRSTDLLYKYQERLFSRRGSYKLSSMDADYNKTIKGDRFADRNQLDFKDMVLDAGKWKKYVRVLVDLSNDLGEMKDIGLKQPGLSTAKDMLTELQRLVGQGYSRGGAQAFENGVNFIGGALLEDQNWHAYKKSRNNKAPFGAIPGLIAENGEHRGSIRDRILIHRAAKLQYDPGKNGGLEHSFYELDGGVLSVSADLSLRSSCIEMYRGKLDLSRHRLLLEKGNNMLVISGGELVADSILWAEGDHVLRFQKGTGSLILSGRTPLEFYHSGDEEVGGYIDFLKDTKGQLISSLSHQDFVQMYGAGRLRINGRIGQASGFSTSGFKIVPIAKGKTCLFLER